MGERVYKERDLRGWIWWKYVYMYVNRKMRPVETIPGMGGGGSKGECWKEWVQLWYTVRTFINVTMYLQYNNN
jgi:hypothetical protein